MLALLCIAGATTRDKISQPVFPERLFVDGNNVIHDQIGLGTTIGAGVSKFMHNFLPIRFVELLLAEAAQYVSDQGILRIPDGVAFVATSRGAGKTRCRFNFCRGVG